MTRSGRWTRRRTRWVSRPDQPGVKNPVPAAGRVCSSSPEWSVVWFTGRSAQRQSDDEHDHGRPNHRSDHHRHRRRHVRCGCECRGVAVTDGTEPCRVSTHIGVLIAIVLDPGFDWDTPASDSSAIEVANVVRQIFGPPRCRPHRSTSWPRPPCPPPAPSCALPNISAPRWPGSGGCTSPSALESSQPGRRRSATSPQPRLPLSGSMIIARAL